MRLKKIKAYGFGKWQDTEWDLSADDSFSVFLGENESGKSSVMQLIHAVLFGFAKEEVERLKPRHGGRFGGSIDLEIDGKHLTVERIHRQRIRGEVTIKHEDGRTGGEEDWKSILQRLDSSTFKGIFHIDLTGLEHLQHVSPAEVNRYLYDAGMTGGQALTDLEKKLKQRADEYYTPQGKVKPLNRLAREWEETEADRTVLAEKLDQISEKRRMISEYERRLFEQSEQEETLNKRLRFYEKASALHTVIRDWSALKNKRAEFQKKRPVRFPVDGLERFERWQQLAEEKKAEIADKNRKIEEKNQLLFKEQGMLLKDDLRQEMSTVLGKKERLNRLYDNITAIKKDIEQLNREKKKLLNEHPDAEAALFTDAIMDVHKLQQFDKIKNERFQLISRYEQLDAREKDLQSRFDEHRHMKTEAKTHLLKETELEELAQEQKKLDEQKEQAARHEEKKQEYDRLKEEKTFVEKREKRTKHKIAGITAGTVFAALLGFFTADFLIVLIALTAGGALVFSTYREKNEWENRLQKIAAMIKDDASGLEEETAKPRMTEEEITLARTKHADAEKEIASREKIEKSLYQEENQIQSERISINDKWAQWNNSYYNWLEKTNLPFAEDMTWYDHFIPDVRKWKELESRIEELKEDERNTMAEIEDLEAEAKQLVEKTDSAANKNRSWYILQEWYERDEERRREIAKVKEIKGDITEQLNELEEKYKQYREKQAELLAYTEVSEEDSFRILGEVEKQFQEMQRRFQEQEVRLQSALPNHQEREDLVALILEENADIEKEKQHLHEQTAAIFSEKEQLIKEKTETAKEVQTLEQDGTYEETKQEKKRIEEEASTLLREWAVMQAALKMISRAKQVYEQNRQPAVMERAEKLFYRLTEGSYQRFFAPLGEETFFVQREDGERFEPADLSRGTRELLYLSLRLALADDEAFDRQYPLIMDEILVNIDKSRRERLIAAFSSISTDRQLLFFTCHRHIYEEIKKCTNHHSLHILDPAAEKR